ncbi:MAG: hypothetical protein IKE46_10800 [Selenomonadaceae bacterium]|nr:hypothetical protein [Selenomonadaceae bacterium]
MSLKKILCEVLAAAMIFSASTFCAAAGDDSANAKLARIETDTYGIEQSGAILDRISRLEKSYSGQNTQGNMNARIDAIYKILYDNSAGPCVLAKINALEWNINHEVRSDGVEKRLAALETAILGKPTEGTFNARIRALAKGSFGEEILPIVQVQIPANTLIKVETTAPVSSKTMQEGDSVSFRVIEDIFVDDKLVFVTGLPGEGTVVNVHRARNIMSNGKIEIDFHTLKTVDGQDAKTFAGVEALEEMKAQSMSRGLSLVGKTFSGKYSGVEEVFVRGKNVELPAGVQVYIQVKDPITIYAVSTSGGGLSIAEPIPQPVNELKPQPVTETQPQPVNDTTMQPVTETTPKPVVQPKPPVPTREPEGLSDDEKIATPPVEVPKPEPKPAPVTETKPKPAPELDDGEIIEIYDED